MVNIKNEDAHGLKIDVRWCYKESNQLFYLIPKNVYTKGLENSNIKKFNDHRDGVLAWKTFKEYYDKDGDKYSFGTQELEKIWASI